MVAVIGEAGVALRPESGKFASEAERDLAGKMGGIGSKAGGLFAAGFAAVAGAGALFGKAISEATDLGESASKVSVVFGDSAAAVEEFASSASSSLGMSEAAALGAAGTFGNLLRSTGMAEDAAAEMSTSMVGLSADLASFNNATPEEALDALRAGLLGEAEPLKKFGVNLNAAAIEAKAAELGLSGLNGELTDSQKATAAHAIIMEQTALAQGDFARTSEGLANQQRIMKAQFLDLAANIGGLFVPSLANASGALTGGLMPAILRMTENLPEVGEALGAVGDVFRLAFSEGLGPALDAYSEVEGFARIVTVVAANLGDLSAVFREAFVDGAVGSANLGASGLLGFATTAGDAAFRIREAFSGAWASLTETLAPVLDSLRATLGAAFSSLGDTLGGAFGGEGGGGPFAFLTTIADAVGPILETVGPLIAQYVTRWAEVFQALVPVILTLVETLVPIFQELFAQIGPLLQQLAPIIAQVAGILATTLVAAIEALAPVLPVIVQALGQVASVLAGALMVVLQALLPILPPILQAFAQIAVVLAGVLAQALAAIAPMLPVILDAFLQLLMAVVIPLLPLLPMLADLFLTLVTALAPLIPPVIQIVALLLQLAMQVITPLLPIITTLIEMFVGIVGALMPIITVGIQIIAFFMNLRVQIIAAVLGLVTGAIGKFGELVTWLGSLPGALLSALGDLGGLLVGAGASLIQGLVNGISSAAGFVGDIAGNIWAAIRSFVNSNLIDRLNGLLEFTIMGVSVNPPDIPRLHSGGVFDSGAGEGYALLRDRERVITPEQRIIADNLLADLLSGRLGGAAAPALGGGAPVSVTNNVTQLPGESGAALAARVTQGTVWNLNHRITRRTGDAAVEPTR